jgi:hypothetical protein
MVPRASSRARRWARRHPLVAGAALLVLVGLVGLVVDLLRVRADVNAGRKALTDLSVEQLDGDLVGTIEDATGHLDRADRVADGSPFLAALGALPGADEQVEGLRALTEAAADLGESARRAATAVDQDLEKAGSEPTARLRLLRTITEELDRIQADASAIDLRQANGLSGPLAKARDQLRAELDGIPERFATARTRVRAAERALQGPTRYLVLAGNNAEMRGGAGMPLSGGILTIQDGDLEFGEFVPTANRWPRPVDPSLVPDEYLTTYRQFRVGESWLQTAVSPNFAAVGPMYDAMSTTFPDFGPVDGVLAVDTVTLRLLLEVIGPVEVDGVRFTADNVEQRLLNESYLRVEPTLEDRAVRQEEQGRVATAIFEALKTRDVSLAALSTTLRAAASGRHLLAYADDEAVQEMFDELGATGALHPASFMATVQNIAADKLDWYIDPSVTVRAVPTTGKGAWQVRVAVRIPNPEREGDTGSVESHYGNGVHRALVALYLPQAASDIRVVGREVSEAGADPPLWMVGTRVFVEEGDEEIVAVEFELPIDHPGMILVPSARVRPVEVSVNGVMTDDAAVRWLGFTAPAEDEPLQAGPVVAAFLAVAGAGTLIVGHRRTGRPRTAARLTAGPSPVERRLPVLGMTLMVAAGATLLVFAAVDALRPR